MCGGTLTLFLLFLFTEDPVTGAVKVTLGMVEYVITETL